MRVCECVCARSFSSCSCFMYMRRACIQLASCRRRRCRRLLSFICKTKRNKYTRNVVKSLATKTTSPRLIMHYANSPKPATITNLRERAIDSPKH